MAIADPQVSLTDYFLCLECTVVCILIYRSRNSLYRLLLLLFASIGFAALIGGTVHGFLTGPSSSTAKLAWRSTILLLGIAGWTESAIAAYLVLSASTAKAVSLLLFVCLLPYAYFTFSGADNFRVAIAGYSFGLLLLLAALVLAVLRGGDLRIGWALLGLALTVFASLVQQGIVPILHRPSQKNALYHLIEAVALWMIYIGMRHLPVKA